jgi:hypothetical protein
MVGEAPMSDGEADLRALNANLPPANEAPPRRRRRPTVHVHHFDCEPEGCVEACEHFGNPGGV